MAAGPVSSPESAVLFCPFCREPFEGLSLCPTHELELLPFRELPPETHDDQPLALGSPRLCRAPLFVGALVTLLAFFLPLASLSGHTHASGTLLSLARARDVWLWLVPMSAAGQLVVLRRRRTPRELRGARVFVLLCALLPSAAVALTLLGVRDAAALLATRVAAPVEVHLGLGAILVGLGALPMLYAGVRLGVVPAPRVKVGSSHA